MSTLFEFTWPHPAGEVFIAGSFNEWKGSKLCKNESGLFTGLVDLGSAEKVCYKYIVDGQWTVNYDGKREYDNSGNENNVLYPEDWQKTAPSSVEETPLQEKPEEWLETPIEETPAQEQPDYERETLQSSIEETPVQEQPEEWQTTPPSSIEETPVQEQPEEWQETPPSIEETPAQEAPVEKTIEPENQLPTNTARCVSPTMSPLTTPAAPTTHVYTVGVPGATFNNIPKSEPAPSTRSSSASSRDSHNEKRELFREKTSEKKKEKRRSVILGRILNLFK